MSMPTQFCSHIASSGIIIKNWSLITSSLSVAPHICKLCPTLFSQLINLPSRISEKPFDGYLFPSSGVCNEMIVRLKFEVEHALFLYTRDCACVAATNTLSRKFSRRRGDHVDEFSHEKTFPLRAGDRGKFFEFSLWEARRVRPNPCVLACIHNEIRSRPREKYICDVVTGKIMRIFLQFWFWIRGA